MKVGLTEKVIFHGGLAMWISRERAFQEEEMQGRGPEVSAKWPGGQREVHQVGLHRSLE